MKEPVIPPESEEETTLLPMLLWGLAMIVIGAFIVMNFV